MVKKHKTRVRIKETSEQKKSLFKQYPGFYIAVIFTIIIFVAYALSVFGTTFNTRSQAAEDLSSEINYLMDYYLSDINASLDGDYDYALEDDYLFSMRDEFEWIKAREKEAYSAFPLSEAEYRELALYLFVDNLLNLDEMISFEFGEPNYQNEINTALYITYETPDILSADLNQLDFSEADQDKIRIYFDEILTKYINEKRLLVQAMTSEERQYVEAKKYNYIKYLNSE